jgi:hypothetical protein
MEIRIEDEAKFASLCRTFEMTPSEVVNWGLQNLYIRERLMRE